MTNDDGCTCYPVPEHLHTTHYGATDPASTLEPDPECPVHFPVTDREPLVRVSGPGVAQIGDQVWIGPDGALPPTGRDLELAGPGAVWFHGGTDHAMWRRVDGMRPMSPTADEVLLDRVRSSAVASWNEAQR